MLRHSTPTGTGVFRRRSQLEERINPHGCCGGVHGLVQHVWYVHPIHFPILVTEIPSPPRSGFKVRKGWNRNVNDCEEAASMSQTTSFLVSNLVNLLIQCLNHRRYLGISQRE